MTGQNGEERDVPDPSSAVDPKIQAAINAATPLIEPNPMEGEGEPGPSSSSSSSENLELEGCLCAVVIGLGGMLAKRRGPHWLIDEREARSVAVPAAEALQELFGRLDSVWDRLAVAVAGVAGPRIAVDLVTKQAARPGDDAEPVNGSE